MMAATQRRLIDRMNHVRIMKLKEQSGTKRMVVVIRVAAGAVAEGILLLICRRNRKTGRIVILILRLSKYNKTKGVSSVNQQ